ncbi:MAG: hypothetical protein ACW991_02450 [Candidatus Hodarchaeales archaeon]|jgi:hypothetical protein
MSKIVDNLTTSIGLNFTVNEPTSWIGYSLDSAANVTITGNNFLDSQGMSRIDQKDKFFVLPRRILTIINEYFYRCSVNYFSVLHIIIPETKHVLNICGSQTHFLLHWDVRINIEVH